MSNSINGVSIVICTYNGRRNLDNTLTHIAAQKNLEGVPVELVVVDNASTDGTYDYTKQRWEELNSPFPLVLLSEPQPGKAMATRLGFANCKYAFLLVCDDDNWLCDTYVRQVYDIMSSNEKIGLLGGKGEPVFESVKPEWFDRFTTLFASDEQYHQSGDVTDKIDNLWGAGMALRKDAWDTLIDMDYQFFLNEQRGKKNWGGDDVELCYMIVNLGYRMWVENKMTYKHYMPANRMTSKYIKSRFYGLGRSRLYLQAYLYARKNDAIPNQHLKYPMWLDKWIHQTKLYWKMWPKNVFKNEEELDDEWLKFIALKGELAELWSLKEEYSAVFAYLLSIKQKIAALKKP